jgi:hypothetical protein
MVRTALHLCYAYHSTIATGMHLYLVSCCMTLRSSLNIITTAGTRAITVPFIEDHKSAVESSSTITTVLFLDEVKCCMLRYRCEYISHSVSAM